MIKTIQQQYKKKKGKNDNKKNKKTWFESTRIMKQFNDEGWN
jgi:hypothetical protein